VDANITNIANTEKIFYLFLDMNNIIATYRYIPYGTKVNVVVTNDIASSLMQYDSDYDESVDYSGWVASFVEGKLNTCYIILKQEATVSDIVHEVTHLVQYVLKYHNVNISDEYDENMAYGISFWSELILASLRPDTPYLTSWVKEQAQISQSPLN
jgi:hypothetical protein